MNKDTHADSGQSRSSDGGTGSIKGRYYPVKGGSSSNMTGKANDAWRPTGSEAQHGSRAQFAAGSGGAKSVQNGGYGGRYYTMGTTAGSNGPGDSGDGTTAEKCGWFEKNKNNTGSGGPKHVTQNSNAGGLSSTTPYGSVDRGKLKR